MLPGGGGVSVEGRGGGGSVEGGGGSVFSKKTIFPVFQNVPGPGYFSVILPSEKCPRV